MTTLTLDGHSGAHVTIDLCAGCQVFWFDQFESLQLSPGATLQLMKVIGEHPAGKTALANVLRCPRCADRLLLTHDIQRNMRFIYWRCGNEHGKLIVFFEFLKEKNFIHPLSPKQIQELRQNIQILNCSNCGAPINLESDSACPFCHSPITMLDMQQPQLLLAQLKEAAGPRPVDPALPMKLALTEPQMEASLSPNENDHEWWSDARSSGLVQAGLNTVGRWLSKLVV